MQKQLSTPASQPGEHRAPKRSYRTIQKPARRGTISYEQALEAALWVKQRRVRTKPA